MRFPFILISFLAALAASLATSMYMSAAEYEVIPEVRTPAEHRWTFTKSEVAEILSAHLKAKAPDDKPFPKGRVSVELKDVGYSRGEEGVVLVVEEKGN